MLKQGDLWRDYTVSLKSILFNQIVSLSFSDINYALWGLNDINDKDKKNLYSLSTNTDPLKLNQYHT